MLKELFDLVKGTASESISNEVPEEQNQEVVAEATNTVASGLRNIVAGGGAQNLLSLFGNKDKGGLLSNPIVSMMIGHFAGKLMSKFNMDSSKANNVAGGLIPGVLGNLVNKVNDPNDNNFSLENLLSSITGGQSTQVAQENQGLNIQDLLGQLTGGGGNSQNSGGGGMMDILGKLAGGAMSQQQKNGGGGLLDLIKGFAK